MTAEIKIGPSETDQLDRHAPADTLLWSKVDRDAASSAMQVILFERAILEIHRHASATENEVAGVLIGDAYEWTGQLFIEIRAILRAGMVRSGPAHITFTAETWSGITRKLASYHPGQRILGWYHSHPRMGIFLSEMDLGIHRAFFPLPWHIALVVNGQDRKLGVFNWSDGDIGETSEIFLSRALGEDCCLELVGRTRPLSYTIAASMTNPSE